MIVIQSRLRECMARKRVKTLRELGRMANISWKVISNLDNDVDIETIQLKNLLKICLALECTLDDLIVINYEEIKIEDLD